MGMSNFSGGSGTNSGNGGNVGIPIGSQPQGRTSSDYDVTQFCLNYNDTYKNSGPALFREDIVKQIMGVLIGKNKPNALLIGPAGTGKTKIVEDLAWRIANNDPIIPSGLIGYTVWELPISNIVSGSSYVGQLEEKLHTVLDYMTDPKNKAILFIDEIHTLCSEGNPIYEKIAQILKPALARGDLKVIGATTTQEYKNLTSDPAFNRRFSKLIVDELTRSETLEILKQLRPSLFMHYGNCIQISDESLETCVILADQFHTAGNHRPDSAITLLDRAIGDAIIQRKAMEAAAANDPALMAALKSVLTITITERQIRTTGIRLMTGNAKKDNLDETLLRQKMKSIKGQDDILEEIVQILKRKDLGLFNTKQPLTMLFAGPSGVGKTEVSKIIADTMTGCPPIILNMTEYHSSASINRIIGAPAGYVGSTSNTELPFDKLESNPYQIILLDEFEKCHPSVQALFMSVFDEGTLQDNRGRLIDFSKSIIIATTNAGNAGQGKHTLGFNTSNGNEKSMKDIISELKQNFRPELLNRFEKIFEFHALSETEFIEILKYQYQTEVERIHKEKPRYKLPDKLSDQDAEMLTKKHYVPEFGARPVRKIIRAFIEDAVIAAKSQPLQAAASTDAKDNRETEDES